MCISYLPEDYWSENLKEEINVTEGKMLIVRGQNIKNDFKKTRKLSNDHPTWEAYKNSVLVVFFFS
jgi:pyruvate/oxaloacetate carboxyltransferase